MTRRTPNRRIRWIFFVAMGLFATLIVRLFQVQWAASDGFDASREQPHVAVRENVKRGRILDRHGRELAVSKNAYSIFVYPSYYRDLERRGHDPARLAERQSTLARTLAKHSDLDEEGAARRIASPRGFEWIQRRLHYEAMEAFEQDLKANGFQWWPRGAMDYGVEERRAYPRGSLAAHVIGYTNIDGVGMDGVELKYDRRLRSRRVNRRALKDGKGRVIDPWAVGWGAPRVSETVVLTIDEAIQFSLEEELKAQCEAKEAAGGVGIVMNPRTGEILALANYPTFNLNEYNDPDLTPTVRRNRAIWAPYEPGSVFKVVTMTALLDERLVSLDEVVFCENGSYRPSPRIRPIKDWHPYGELTFAEVIQKSSNIGVLKIASRFEQDQFREWVERFRVDRKTNVDLPYERSGTIAALTSPTEYAMYFAPWGQGISATPLQTLSAVNAIANRGVLTQPRVVKEIVGAGSEITERFSSVTTGRVASEATCRTATEVMVGVVESGSAAKIDGVRVAGKTGTSQKVEEGVRGYKSGAYISSFVGFFPANDPEYSILILIDEPQGQHYGGQVAAPVFNRVARAILQSRDMMPLRDAVSIAPDAVEPSVAAAPTER